MTGASGNLGSELSILIFRCWVVHMMRAAM
jgi:hypothetical protein